MRVVFPVLELPYLTSCVIARVTWCLPNKHPATRVGQPLKVPAPDPQAFRITVFITSHIRFIVVGVVGDGDWVGWAKYDNVPGARGLLHSHL